MASNVYDGAYSQPGGLLTSTVHEPTFDAQGYPLPMATVRTYKQTVAAWLADRRENAFVLGSTSDPETPDSYLMNNSAPNKTASNLYSFNRTFSRVPADVVTYGSRVITKPTAASAGGTALTTQYFYSSAGVLLGNYTTYLSHVFAPNNSVYGPEAATTSVNSGANTRVTWATHGLAGTEAIETRSSGWGGGDSRRITAAGGYSVIDPNTIDILGFNLGVTVANAGKYLREYSPSTDRVGTRKTQRFYLPGVTANVTTPADIELPALLMNDVDFISSILANTTGFQDYDATALERWNGWPIYTQTFEAINMANL
jgi:hypothetical protein